MNAHVAPKTITRTAQQQAFIDACLTGTSSLILVAVAGAGKTTTVLDAACSMRPGVAICAYNRDIAIEIKGKLEARGVNFKQAEAGTVHSFGFRAYRKAFPKAVIDDKKVEKILEQMFDDVNSVERMYGSQILKLVSMAKNRAVGIVEQIDADQPFFDIIARYDILGDEDDSERTPVLDIINAARKVLRANNRMVDVIDFDDMIYLPLIHNVRFWRYNAVFVDEAQDTNPARRAIVRAMLQPGGRVIAVGDPRQAIYGFTGADTDSLDVLKRDFNAKEMPLTVSFRCPQKVVAFAQQWASHIQAAPTAPEGTVSSCKIEDFFKREDLTKESAVLCRNTKPLVELAFSLIRAKIPCMIEGKDIAEQLCKLVTRWKVKTLDGLETRLDTYIEKQRTKLLAAKKDAELERIEDTVDTIRVIIDQCRAERLTTVADAVEYIQSLFGKDVKDRLVLSTIHKSKGREWKNVFWLDRVGTCPSRHAKTEEALQQEFNLCYVAATRAMANLIELGPVKAK